MPCTYLERNNNELELLTRMRADVLADLRHIVRVERGIHLVQHKERRRLERVDGKEERECCHGLLATR